MNRIFEKPLHIIFLSSFYGILLILFMAQSFAGVGRAVNVQGKVLLRNPDFNKVVKELKSGDTIVEGSIINTSSHGSVKLLMSDRTLLDLGPSTLFKIDEYKTSGKKKKIRQASLTLEYGKIRALVTKRLGKKSKFRIRTRSATMGVRGTEFMVLADLEQAVEKAPRSNLKTKSNSGSLSKSNFPTSGTEIIVKRGRVDVSIVSSTRPVILTEKTKMTLTDTVGNATTANRKIASQSVKVEKISLKEVQAKIQNVKIVDQTFKQMVVVDKSNVGSKDSGGETLKRLFEGMKDIELKLPETEDFRCAGYPNEFTGLDRYRPTFESYVEATVKFNH